MKTANPKLETPSTIAVAAALGLTYRQIYHWLRSGYLGATMPDTSPGSGVGHVWTQDAIERLQVLALGTGCGLAPRRVSQALDNAGERPGFAVALMVRATDSRWMTEGEDNRFLLQWLADGAVLIPVHTPPT
jgi:hypothetical protein